MKYIFFISPDDQMRTASRDRSISPHNNIQFDGNSKEFLATNGARIEVSDDSGDSAVELSDQRSRDGENVSNHDGMFFRYCFSSISLTIYIYQL